MDADDFLGCDCVERVVQKQRESGADLVRFSYQLVYPDGRIQEPIDSFTEEVFLPKAAFTEQIYPYFLSSIRFNAVWATLYPRELLAGLTFPTGMKTAEDAAFSLEVYTRAECIVEHGRRLFLCPNANWVDPARPGVARQIPGESTALGLSPGKAARLGNGFLSKPVENVSSPADAHHS